MNKAVRPDSSGHKPACIPEDGRYVPVSGLEWMPDTEQFFETIVEHVPAIIYLAPPEDPGDVRYVSPYILQALGYSQEEWMARRHRWDEHVHPDDLDETLATDASSAESGEDYNIRYRLQHRDGHYVWLRDHTVLVHDEQGEPRFWLGFTFDISGLKETEDALLEAEERYRSLVEQIPAVTFTVGVDQIHHPIYLSPQVEEMFGYTREEWRADTEFWLKLIHPDDLPGALAEVRLTDELNEPFKYEYRMIARDGRTVWVQNESRLVHDAEGVPKFWHGVLLDITDRKLAEESLLETEALYRTLVEQIPVATFIEPLDGKGVPSYVSPQVYDILGFSREYWQERMDAGVQALHPDDLERWQQAVEQTDATGEPFNLEHRMIRADGQTIWVMSTARLVHDDSGTPQFWQGTIQDITTSVLADQRLAESEQRYRSLFDHNPDAVYSFTLEGSLTSANAALGALTGYSDDELLNAHFASLIAPDDVAMVTRHFENAASGTPQSYECLALRKDGSTLEISVTNLPIIVGGEIVGVYGVAKDISERKQLERQLKHMAFHDWLTGLPNRGLFMERLHEALGQLGRQSDMLALLFVDLDDFKVVNDSWGHDTGDQALRQIASRIRFCVRSGDTISRLGGDEFTVLLTDVSSVDDALDVASRILNQFSNPFDADGISISLSVSIGIVVTSSPDEVPEQLLQRGDAAMYDAKRQGKGRYVVSSPGAGEPDDSGTNVD